LLLLSFPLLLLLWLLRHKSILPLLPPPGSAVTYGSSARNTSNLSSSPSSLSIGHDDNIPSFSLQEQYPQYSRSYTLIQVWFAFLFSHFSYVWQFWLSPSLPSYSALSQSGCVLVLYQLAKVILRSCSSSLGYPTPLSLFFIFVKVISFYTVRFYPLVVHSMPILQLRQILILIPRLGSVEERHTRWTV